MKQEERKADTPGAGSGVAASRNPKGSVWRLPFFSALVVLAAGVLVWRSLLPLEAERRELQTQKTGVALVSAVGGKLRAQIDASLRQTERLGRLDTSRDAFERDAQLFLRDFVGVLAIRYSRGDDQFQVARPDVDASNVFAGFDAVATESTQARIDGYTQALSRPAHVGKRTLYFLRFTHIADAQTLTMTTALDVQSWLGEPLAQETGYRAAVLDGDDPVIDAAHIARSDANAQVFPLVGAGRPWTLVVAPGPVLLAATESHLPQSVLGGTVLLALAIGLATYLALLARERKDRVADHEERRRSAEAARDIAHSDLGSVLESITDGFIIFDSEFRYTSINDVGARLAGLPAAEMIGRSVWELFPGFAATPEAALMRSAMAERKSISFERLRADGRFYSMRTYPHRDGMALYFHDVSAQRRIADRLRKSETLLNLAQSIASIGSFTYDVNTHEEHWSDQMLPLLGLTHEQRDGRRFLNFVEPGDCVRLVEAEAQLGVEFPEKEVRLHVVRPNGERRAVVTRMRLERDGDELGAFIVGTVQDITNFESAEQARTAALSQSRQQSAKFRALNRAMLLINAKLGHPDLHQVLVEELRETVRAHIGVLQFDAPGMQPVTSFSEKYTNWLHASSTVTSLHRLAESGRTGKPMRLSQADLAGNPIWSALNALPSDHRELHGLLSVPLYDRRGERLGFLQASDRLEGEFSADDEAIAVQFAQIASVAIGWARLIDDLRKTQVDLSEQLEEIRRSRALLAEAQRVARLGSWEIEPPLALPLRITLSEEAARIVESDAVIAFDALAERVHDDDAEMLRQRLGDLVSGHITSLDAEVRYRAANAFKRLHIKAQVAIDRGNLSHVVGSLQDVTQQRLDAEQDRLNAVAFAGIAAGIPLDDSLAVIIGMYESRFPDGICSILLYDPQKGLRTGAAPGLPAEYSQAISGVFAGPAAGSCGTAIWRRERVIVTDTQTDPLWADYAALAAQHGLMACWSTPIFDGARNAVGTFAVYYRTARGPTREELDCVDRAAYVAAVAIAAQRSRQQIEDREQRFRSLFTYVPEAVFALDMEGNIVDCNVAAENMTGYSRQELVHSPLSLTVAPELHERLASHLAKVSSGAMQQIELQRVRRDGSRYTSVSFKSPIIVDGALVGIFSIVRDVTVERANQLALEDALRTVKGHNRELEEFAFVASHDLQEPLRKVRAFGDRLRMHLDSRADPESLDYIERMRAAAERMQRLIDDLLAYSRVAKTQRAPRRIELRDVLAGVLTDLETSIEQKHAEVTSSNLPSIDADETQMRQLLQNLISNALKFVQEGRAPRITVQGDVFWPDNGFDRRPWVRIVVADNGIGFDNKYAERIFAAFQRLHGQRDYSGSGIGLAIVRRIVERHGGQIRADGTLGEGARFVIEMPQHGRELEPARADETAEANT